MAYNISGHSLLEGQANGLAGEDLAAHQRVAEVLLGFAAASELTDATKRKQAQDAIAMQVSYQVAAGIDAFVAYQQYRGARKTVYRGGPRRMTPIHPIARKIANSLLNATATVVQR